MSARLLLLTLTFLVAANSLNVFSNNCWYVLDRVYENGNSRSMTPEEVDRLKDYGVQLAEYSVSLTQSLLNLGRDGWPQPPVLPCYCDKDFRNVSMLNSGMNCLLILAQVLIVFSLSEEWNYHEYVNEECFYKNDFVFDHMISRPMTKNEQAEIRLWLEESKIYGLASIVLMDEIGLGKPRLPCFCVRCE
ncbi:hypothetical protein PRIPAC_75736 [Pristionchus pacificus]|uniref:Uncharacterized protein n=1 Tax=Pristionchus pacificus TaxID=54126 RepID=A0A454XKW8_PRIPA|nr:hypothetical protein PRIPAC_75736 [Pristionchus pacificus]|eukprot:PDM81120.1 hypothetical protein PRIPAC_36123 [Pristionchus pacificus]